MSVSEHNLQHNLLVEIAAHIVQRLNELNAMIELVGEVDTAHRRVWLYSIRSRGTLLVSDVPIHEAIAAASPKLIDVALFAHSVLQDIVNDRLEDYERCELSARSDEYEYDLVCYGKPKLAAVDGKPLLVRAVYGWTMTGEGIDGEEYLCPVCRVPMRDARYDGSYKIIACPRCGYVARVPIEEEYGW